jgi:hypothetical protein
MANKSLYRVLEPIPELSAEPGDMLIVRLGNRCPFILQRPLSPVHLTILHTDAVAPIQEGVPIADRKPHRPKLEVMK